MEAQNYKNHIRFYYPHHFIYLPLILFLTIYSAYQYLANDREEYAVYALIFLLIGWLAVMLRQHYALGNQNRIVRLEMRLRYYQLNHEKFELIEQKLSFAQLAALRFAPDEELNDLIKRTLAENLSAKDIKQSIINWYPDYMRL